MKKLKLKAMDLGADEVLSRSQLKNILGGGDPWGSGNPTGNNCVLLCCTLPDDCGGAFILTAYGGPLSGCSNADCRAWGASLGASCSGPGGYLEGRCIPF